VVGKGDATGNDDAVGVGVTVGPDVVVGFGATVGVTVGVGVYAYWLPVTSNAGRLRRPDNMLLKKTFPWPPFNPPNKLWLDEAPFECDAGIAVWNGDERLNCGIFNWSPLEPGLLNMPCGVVENDGKLNACMLSGLRKAPTVTPNSKVIKITAIATLILFMTLNNLLQNNNLSTQPLN
jgi:hypothetical protein